MSSTAIKDVLNLALLREIAAELQSAHAPFDATAFVARSMDGLHELELTGRAAHIAEALHQHLP